MEKFNKKFDFQIFKKPIKKNFLIINRFKRKLYKPAFYILLFQFLLIIFFLYDQRGRLNIRLQQFNEIIGLSIDSLNVKDYKNYISDSFRSLVSRKQIPKVYLSLSFKDIQKLECDRKRLNNCSKDGWVRANFKSGDEIYKIKLKAKGDRDIHRLDLKQMSFKVDIRGDKRFNGFEEFSIQLPIIRNYTYEPLVARLMRKNNIASTRHQYVRFYINGEYVGIRHVEEGMSRELIESAKKRFGPIFNLQDNVSAKYDSDISFFNLSDKQKFLSSEDNNYQKVLSILVKSKEDPSLFNKYFDVDKWAKYMALLESLKLIHGTSPKSVRFYLNTSSGLIEPIFFDGHRGGWFKNYRLSDVLIENKEDIKCTLTCSNIYFYRMLFGVNNQVNYPFYNSYIKALKRYTSENFFIEEIKPEWDKLWLERGTIYRELSSKDVIYNKGLFPHIASLENIKSRLKMIRNELIVMNSKFPNYSISNKNNYLLFENKASRLPQKLGIYCGREIIESLYLVQNHPKKFSLENFTKCDKKNLYFSISKNKNIGFKNLLLRNKDFEEIISINQNLNNNYINNKKEIVSIKNNQVITKDLKYDNKKIIFDSGINICLENNANLLIKNSEVQFKSKDNLPVKIKGCNNSKSSIVIDNSDIFIENLLLENLSSPEIDLRNLFGGINIVNSNLNGKNIKILNSLSEDALNFIDSNIKIKNINFDNVKSDALDSDFSNIYIDTISCNNIGNDCLDLSFSNGKVSKLEGYFVKDKVLSLGEKSNLKINEIFSISSEMGIVAKDSSSLLVSNYFFEGVKIPIAAYIKKSEFGSPYIKINTIKNKTFDKNFISRDSSVFIDNILIKGKKGSNEVSKLLYGNIYGVKTKR